VKLRRVYGQAVWVEGATVGKRRFGVPPGGAFDAESAGLLRALLGLPSGAPVLEIAGSAELEVEEDGTLALAGAPVSASLDGEERPANAAWPVRRGDIVRLNATREGARVYVAAMARELPARRLAALPTSLDRCPIRIVAGPDAVDLPREGWTVSPASDRIGLRLTGPGVVHRVELPSRPTAPGTIQVTPSGMPILLGPDGPTIGGYPQAAVVARVDLDRLGQRPLGAEVRFEEIGLEEARVLWTAHREGLERRLAALRLTL
jgi:allophanate hydrolase subunit 2